MISFSEIKSRDQLFILIIHLLNEKFMDHAILKGGMVLRLFGSKRETMDLDYVFIPYKSKNDILPILNNLLSKIEGLKYIIKTHSKMIRIIITVNNIDIQLEINVAKYVKTDVISTANLKSTKTSIAPRVIKIMSLDVALSHKLAAWNERRLLRDVYDIFYLYDVQNILPDKEVLLARLSDINSRIPKLKKIKSLKISEFSKQLKIFVNEISQEKVEKELFGLVDEIELTGLSMRIKDSLRKFCLEIMKI